MASDTCYGQLASLMWSDLAQEEPHETNEQPDGRKVRLSLFNCTQFFLGLFLFFLLCKGEIDSWLETDGVCHYLKEILCGELSFEIGYESSFKWR